MPFPLEAQMVQAAEAALGVKFPSSFSTKMQAENGGTVEAAPPGISAEERHDWTWELIPILDTSSRKRLSRTCNDIVRETISARSQPGFPPGAVLIGEDGTGDLLLLLPCPGASELDDGVYWWAHETRRTEKVADDFGELRVP